MKVRTITVIAIATMLATTGAVVAAPGNAPNLPDNAHDMNDTEQNDDSSKNATVVEEMNEKTTGREDSDRAVGAGASGADVRAENSQGPPTDLPAQVPEHVGQIHDLIRQFLNDDVGESLGNAISDVVAQDDGNAGPQGNH